MRLKGTWLTNKKLNVLKAKETKKQNKYKKRNQQRYNRGDDGASRPR